MVVYVIPCLAFALNMVDHDTSWYMAMVLHGCLCCSMFCLGPFALNMVDHVISWYLFDLLWLIMFKNMINHGKLLFAAS